MPDDWADVFRIPYTCTKSTKLQAFQYQVIHRYIPTKRFLFVRHIVDRPNCFKCNDDDTITHHLFRCPRVLNFWNDVFAYNANRKL